MDQRKPLSYKPVAADKTCDSVKPALLRCCAASLKRFASHFELNKYDALLVNSNSQDETPTLRSHGFEMVHDLTAK